MVKALVDDVSVLVLFLLDEFTEFFFLHFSHLGWQDGFLYRAFVHKQGHVLSLQLAHRNLFLVQMGHVGVFVLSSLLGLLLDKLQDFGVYIDVVSEQEFVIIDGVLEMLDGAFLSLLLLVGLIEPHLGFLLPLFLLLQVLNHLQSLVFQLLQVLLVLLILEDLCLLYHLDVYCVSLLGLDIVDFLPLDELLVLDLGLQLLVHSVQLVFGLRKQDVTRSSSQPLLLFTSSDLFEFLLLFHHALLGHVLLFGVRLSVYPLEGFVLRNSHTQSIMDYCVKAGAIGERVVGISGDSFLGSVSLVLTDKSVVGNRFLVRKKIVIPTFSLLNNRKVYIGVSIVLEEGFGLHKLGRLFRGQVHVGGVGFPHSSVSNQVQHSFIHGSSLYVQGSLVSSHLVYYPGTAKLRDVRVVLGDVHPYLGIHTSAFHWRQQQVLPFVKRNCCFIRRLAILGAHSFLGEQCLRHWELMSVELLGLCLVHGVSGVVSLLDHESLPLLLFIF
mmetsp:Transcript_18304/g.17425  ORF Transcript_18304/g.17425 Transcript_18304/m.17425 type:complete len:495 (-) Transcript_18304:162-1646(-)